MARILTVSTGLLIGGASLAVALSPQFANAADGGGQKVFQGECSVCHSPTAKGGASVGPRLFGVSGRKAGTLAGFKYSAAMRNSGPVWTDANLARYIADPAKTVPGNAMPYQGLKDAAKVSALVKYLDTLK